MDILEIDKYLKELGLNVELENEIFKGYCSNIKKWGVFRIWKNKKGRLTVKTKGVQKSFNCKNKEDFKIILKGFEII